MKKKINFSNGLAVTPLISLFYPRKSLFEGGNGFIWPLFAFSELQPTITWTSKKIFYFFHFWNQLLKIFQKNVATCHTWEEKNSGLMREPLKSRNLFSLAPSERKYFFFSRNLNSNLIILLQPRFLV